MSEWQEYFIEDIASPEKNAMSTGPFGSAISSKYFIEDGVPVIRGGNLSFEIGNKLDDEGLVFISKEKAEEFSRSTVSSGDLVFTCWGTINQVGLIDHRSKFSKYVISNKQMKLTPDPTKADSLFLYYLFSSPEKQQEILNNGIGAAVPGFNLGQLKKMTVSLPHIEEQKSIASILSSLDDKIDLLHRQNKTLEAMAETLFRQWFVEGVREDWESRPLSQIATFLNGLACQKYPPENDFEKLPVLKIRELSSGISDASDWASSKVRSEYIIEAGDVIFAWSASLTVKIWDGAKCVLNQHLFKVTSEKYPKWFYLLWCKHHLDEFISISSSHATTMGHIKRSDLDAAMVLIPSDHEINVMSDVMTPIIEKQICIAKQIKSLEKLRDTLLPKLMSGEVRIS